MLVDKVLRRQAQANKKGDVPSGRCTPRSFLACVASVANRAAVVLKDVAAAMEVEIDPGAVDVTGLAG